MVSNIILELFYQYGYLIFYFVFFLGLFGIFILNEIMIISGVILSYIGVIDVGIIYFCILFGFLIVIIVVYVVGKLYGVKNLC